MTYYDQLLCYWKSTSREVLDKSCESIILLAKLQKSSNYSIRESKIYYYHALTHISISFDYHYVLIKFFFYHLLYIIMNTDTKSQQQPNQPIKNILYHSEALKLFLPFLKLSDILASATISREWQYHIALYFKQFLLPEQYAVLNADVFQTVKLVYNRRLVLQQGNTTKYIQIPQICSKVESGNHVTKFQTLEGNTYIHKNNKLKDLNKNDWLDPYKVYKMPSKFQYARCIGNYVYLVGDCQIVRYTTAANIQNIGYQELVLDFDANIQHFILSISAALVVIHSNKGAQYIFFTHKQHVLKKIQLPVSVDNPSNDITLDFGTHGFVISSQGTLYEADFEKEKVQLNEFKGLKGRAISKLKCGYKHYFAFERKQKLTKNWTNGQVLQWAEREGFDNYLKILQQEKVTGQKLLKMNKTYMQDVLGITSTLTQQKMNLLIKEGNKSNDNYEDYIVHGWGKNDKGQLCSNPSANINNPIKLKLSQDQEIYACFVDHTILFNKKTNELTINMTDEQGKLRWEKVTQNKIWTFSGNKQIILYCQSVGKKRIPQALSQEPIHNKKQKLRTAKNIMDQIQWDTNLNKQQFIVGYNSRFEGTLQCNFEQFIKSDVKENNILYFKKEGKLVWDKKTRFDIL